MSAALWVDATAGAAGDMMLGALLDAGASLSDVQRALDGLAAGSEPVGVRVEQVRRHGLRATHAVVETPLSSVRRGPAQISALIESAALPEAARSFALAVFDALARAEAHVHGVDMERVHFHEVGALDSLADVVGCAVALHGLGLLAPDVIRVVSSIALGGGTARTDHGIVPVPVPATLELLAAVGAPVSAGAGDRELCTPTGAALLATLATGWGSLPAVTVRRSGSGAGSWDPLDRPNLLRVVIGESAPVGADHGWRNDQLLVVETTVDDLDPRLWPEVLEQVQAAGAADVWLTPVLMRHGRPGHVVTALTPPDRVDGVVDALVQSSTTLGVRVHPVQRRALGRDRVTVQVDGHPVGVKRGLRNGRVLTVQPEYAEARSAAAALGIPVRQVIDRARAAATDPGAGAAPSP